MRIGHITSYMPPHMGGLENAAEILFQGYLRFGHDVRWVSSRIPREAPAREAGRVRVRTFNGSYEHLGLPLPIWGREGFRELMCLARWADVLQVHGGLYPTTAETLLVSRLTKTPVVLTQHIQPSVYGSPAVNAAQSVGWRVVARTNIRRADAVVAATPAAERYLQEVRPGDFTTILNGTDTERFTPGTADEQRAARVALGIDPERRWMLFVGRLVERKGLEVLLELVPRLQDWSFLVVGDGPRRDEIPQHDRLKWLQRVEPEDMPAVYRAADVVLFPARGEGLPLVVQEGFATGRPVLTRTDEVFAEPLLAAGAAIGIEGDADSVIDVLASPDLDRLAAAAARGRLWAVEHWSVEAAVASYISVMERLLP